VTHLKCDICARVDGVNARVQRFGLVKSVEIDGHRTSRGAGCIDLCNRCWEHYAKPRRRRRLRSVA
jgi:hypothetical protein